MRGTTLFASQQRNVPTRPQLLTFIAAAHGGLHLPEADGFFTNATALFTAGRENYLFRFFALLVLYGASSSFSNTFCPVER